MPLPSLTVPCPYLPMWDTPCTGCTLTFTFLDWDLYFPMCVVLVLYLPQVICMPLTLLALPSALAPVLSLICPHRSLITTFPLLFYICLPITPSLQYTTTPTALPLLLPHVPDLHVLVPLTCNLPLVVPLALLLLLRFCHHRLPCVPFHYFTHIATFCLPHAHLDIFILPIVNLIPCAIFLPVCVWL